MRGRLLAFYPEAPLSRTDDRRLLLVALGAAGVTIALVLGILGTPVVDACAGDPRGLVACMRDLAHERFERPGRRAEVPSLPEPALQAAEPIARTMPPAAQADPIEPFLAVDEEPSGTGTLTPSRDTPASEERILEAAVPAEAAIPDVTAPPLPVPLDPAPEITTDAVSAPARVGAAVEMPATLEPATAPVPLLPPAPTPAPIEQPAPADVASIAPVEPTPEPETAAPIMIAPTIDAIELDGASSYVSGSGPAGSLVRLYADGKLVGESLVEEGRWVVDAGPILSLPRRELRIEAIEPETGKPLGTAAITIEIQLPEPSPPAATPSGGEQPHQPADEQITPPATETSPAGDEVKPLSVEPTPTPVEPGADAKDVLEPEALIPEPVTPVAEPSPEAEHDLEASSSQAFVFASPPEPGTGTSSVVHLPAPVAAVPMETTPAMPGGSELTASLPGPLEPAIQAEFKLPQPRPSSPVTSMRTFAFSDPVYGRFSGGKAVIRRGDTLWSLAHRYYGAGRHYRTIFNANRELLRRAARIFPGQVLYLPIVTEE